MDKHNGLSINSFEFTEQTAVPLTTIPWWGLEENNVSNT